MVPKSLLRREYAAFGRRFAQVISRARCVTVEVAIEGVLQPFLCLGLRLPPWSCRKLPTDLGLETSEPFADHQFAGNPPLALIGTDPDVVLAFTRLRQGNERIVSGCIRVVVADP